MVFENFIYFRIEIVGRINLIDCSFLSIQIVHVYRVIQKNQNADEGSFHWVLMAPAIAKF